MLSLVPPLREGAPKVAAIVPAAGASRRMGRPKLVLPWAGGTVLEATVAALLGGGIARVVVVTGATGPLASWHPPPTVTVVANVAPERGMLSSVRAGLQALQAIALPDVLAVCPGDLPALQPATVRELLEEQRRHGGLVVPTHGGKRGHPLLVPARWLPAIDSLEEAIGLRHLLILAAGELLRHPVADAGTVRDVDTPMDYEELRPDG
jgi:CTP:molybdopterin cytidylyltransferase MocA